MKYILIIGDGMADDPVEELGGKTPLQAARKPVMDGLAAHSLVGSVKNCPDGLPAGSDTAILSIFGCDPRKCYTGRAPLEAAAQNLTLAPGDLAFRCNMASISEGDMPLEEKTILSHSGGGIDGESSQELIKWLFTVPEFREAAEKARVTVSPTLSYRHIAVQAGGDITGLKLNPPHDHLGERVGDNLPSGNANAEVLTSLIRLSNKYLGTHPINKARVAAGKLPCNCIWFWAEGTAAALPSFTKAFGKSGAVISAVPLCHGIAAMTGLDRIYVDGATGELDTNYAGKADAAVQALESGLDFVAVHVEAPDECTHNHDLPGKIESIEKIDELVVGRITERMSGERYRMLILSDHKTLTATGAHGGAPVPFMIYDSGAEVAGPADYSEASGEKGPYVDAGVRLMSLLFGMEQI